jgi:hypothetical protein
MSVPGNPTGPTNTSLATSRRTKALDKEGFFYAKMRPIKKPRMYFSRLLMAEKFILDQPPLRSAVKPAATAHIRTRLGRMDLRFRLRCLLVLLLGFVNLVLRLALLVLLHLLMILRFALSASAHYTPMLFYVPWQIAFKMLPMPSAIVVEMIIQDQDISSPEWRDPYAAIKASTRPITIDVPAFRSVIIHTHVLKFS